MSFFFDHWELDPTMNCSSKKIKKQKKEREKALHFSNDNTIILIPSRFDYAEAGIDLWYKDKDQFRAQCQVADETKALMRLNPILTFEQAMSFLYQPEADYVTEFRLDEMDERASLRILYVDYDAKSNEKNSSDISMSLQKYNRWIITYEYMNSAKSAVKYIADGYVLINKFDLILVNTNIGADYLTLVREFRGRSKDSLIGIIFDEISELEVLSNRACMVDFMWPGPIHSSIEMLPLVLSSGTPPESRVLPPE
jgi:PleD family two-component response regulator